MATRVLGMEKKRFVGRVSYTVKNTKMRVAESKTDTRQKNVWEEGKKLPHPKEKEKL